MKTTTLWKSETFALDTGQDIRQALLSQWGDKDAICVGHAYDGVIWGRVCSQELSIPHDSNPCHGAQLRWETLLDLRLFDKDKELRIWRSGDSFEAIMLGDSEGAKGEESSSDLQDVYFRDQAFELIRSPKEKAPKDDAFVELTGLAGQCHYPPGPAPAKLRTRIYYQADSESGLVSCTENRLLSLEPWRENK